MCIVVVNLIFKLQRVLFIISGKKPHLFVTIMKAFENWLLKLDDKRLDCLDDFVKLRAFGFMVREAISFPHGMDTMARCYLLQYLSDPQPFLVLIRQILQKKDYLKVSILSLQYEL